MREMKTPLQKHFQLWQAHEERKRKLLQVSTLVKRSAMVYNERENDV